MAVARKGTSPAMVLANRAQETRIVINDYPADKSLTPWPPAGIGVHDHCRRIYYRGTGVVFCTQWKRHGINRPGVADLRAGCAAAGRLDMRLHLAQINEPINDRKRPAGGTPRGIAHFKNEPEKCCGINRSMQKRT
jgi:hypothetical protein